MMHIVIRLDANQLCLKLNSVCSRHTQRKLNLIFNEFLSGQSIELFRFEI